MAQRKRTPKHLKKLVEYAENHAMHVTEMIRVKLKIPVENQAEHVREASIEALIARQQGFNSAVEAVLMEYGCYAGFSYLAATPQWIAGTEDGSFVPSVGPDHAEYAEWRRRYYTQ
jgi:predicted naringenin-chalcone synthase